MSDIEEKCEVQDLGSLHHYRTEIPNIIFHLKLDPWAFKAYCVIKMTAGDKGACFKSNSRMSEEIGCSVPTLIKLKNQLVDEGLIIIKKRNHQNGGSMPDLIQIVDVWGMNMEYMGKLYPRDPKNDPRLFKLGNEKGGKRDLVGGVNGINGGSKPGLDKQDLKEQDLKKQQQPAAVPLSNEKEKQKPKLTPKLHAVDIPLADKLEIASTYEPKVIDNAIDWATDPKNPPKKCLAASIKFGCKNKLQKELPKPDIELVNKAYALKYQGQTAGSAKVDALNKHVEITQAGTTYSFCLNYNVKGFIDQFTNALRKSNFRIIPV